MGDTSRDLKEFESILRKLKIRRIVHSLMITSFENISERFSLTYVNLDDCKHDILSLPLMKRITQRSMKVYDGSNNELTILPSYKTNAVFRKLSLYYLDEIVNKMRNVNYDAQFDERIFELRRLFRKVFKYMDNEEEINHTIRIFKDISPNIESLPPEYKEEVTV